MTMQDQKERLELLKLIADMRKWMLSGSPEDSNYRPILNRADRLLKNSQVEVKS